MSKGAKPDVSLEDAVEEGTQQDSPPEATEPPSIENASQPLTLQEGDPNASGPWIQYNGVATVRIMDKASWASAGVDSEKYVQWNYLNNKRVPRSEFSDDELQYLLRIDGRFTLEDDETG